MKSNTKNIIILGSGRSGTSLVAGVVGSEFYQGPELHEPTAANPKGFFESWEINDLNEAILIKMYGVRIPLISRLIHGPKLGTMQNWLADFPVGTPVRTNSEIENRIKKLVANEPFCFKDPRFSYTLPAWRPFLKNTVFICVFRDPATTAESMRKECEKAPYLRTIKMDEKRALRIWRQMYKHILETHRAEGEWLFLHYDQVMTSEGLDRLEKILQIKIDRSFPDAALTRTSSSIEVPAQAVKIYETLCGLAAYSPKAASHV